MVGRKKSYLNNRRNQAGKSEAEARRKRVQSSLFMLDKDDNTSRTEEDSFSFISSERKDKSCKDSVPSFLHRPSCAQQRSTATRHRMRPRSRSCSFSNGEAKVEGANAKRYELHVTNIHIGACSQLNLDDSSFSSISECDDYNASNLVSSTNKLRIDIGTGPKEKLSSKVLSSTINLVKRRVSQHNSKDKKGKEKKKGHHKSSSTPGDKSVQESKSDKRNNLVSMNHLSESCHIPRKIQKKAELDFSCHTVANHVYEQTPSFFERGLIKLEQLYDDTR